MMRVVDVVVMMGGGVAVDTRDELSELYNVWLAGPALRREIADRAQRLGYGVRCINRAFEEHGALTVIGNRGRGSAAVWSADKHSLPGIGATRTPPAAQSTVLPLCSPAGAGKIGAQPSALTSSRTSCSPITRPHPTYLRTIPTDRLGFDAVWFGSRVWDCELPDPHARLFAPIVQVLDRLGYEHDLRQSQDMPLGPSDGRRYYYWYGYVIRCRPPQHLAHLLPRLHIRYAPSDPTKSLIQVRVFPSVHAPLDLNFVGQLLLALADVVVAQLRWRDILQIDLDHLFEVSLLELAWDWPLYYGRLDEVLPLVHVPYARQTSIEDVPYEGRCRWGSLKSGASVFVGYTKVEDGLVFRRWERRVRPKALRKAGIRFWEDLQKPEVAQLYTAQFPEPYSRWREDAIGRFQALQQPAQGTAMVSSIASPDTTPTTTADDSSDVATTTSPDPRDPSLVRATYSAEHQVVERFWQRELTPVIGAAVAEKLASGVPVLTQADRLAMVVPSAKLQAIFENVDLTPVNLRAGDRAARRCLGQLRRQVPQHVHDLRMALRGVQTVSECGAMVACLDAAVQLQRALDDWIVRERNDSVNKRLRRRQKRRTKVTCVAKQVEEYHQLVDRVRHTQPLPAGVRRTATRGTCSSMSAHRHGWVGGTCGPSLSRTGQHYRPLRAEGVLRIVTPSCATLAGLGGLEARAHGGLSL